MPRYRPPTRPPRMPDGRWLFRPWQRIVWWKFGTGRVSMRIAEVLYRPTPAARVSMRVEEVVYRPTTITARVSMRIVEVLYTQQQPHRGSQIIWID